jgi:uncharacterized membrane protein YdjX (TVP38/TMEM64 family)
MAGALLSAAFSYSIGHLIGRHTVWRFAGKKIRELNKRLVRRGLVTIIALRIIPLAPFTVINLVAGASQIRFRDFMLGSTIGLLPGITGISVFTDQLAATIQKPDLPAFTALVAVAAIIIVIAWTCWRWANRRRDTMNASPVTQSD